MTAYYRTAAYRSAVAHPFHVAAFADLMADPTVVGFQSEDEARRFASLRPERLIDLVANGRGVIAARRALSPAGTDGWRDDFPDTRV